MWLQGRLQQLLTTQVGQGQGRPRFILGVCPRRQIVGNVTRTFRMDSPLRRAKESCVPATTPPNLPDDWAQWGGDLPSRLSGSCPAR